MPASATVTGDGKGLVMRIVLRVILLRFAMAGSRRNVQKGLLVDSFRGTGQTAHALQEGGVPKEALASSAVLENTTWCQGVWHAVTRTT